MIRPCFLSPNIGHTRRVVAALKRKGIPEKHIYVVAKHGVELQDLPDAGAEADDFRAASERGVALGGGGSLLAGPIAVAFPMADVPKARIAEYEKAIAAADPSVSIAGIEPPAAILG